MNTIPRAVLIPFVASLLPVALAAQDLLGVTWNGTTVLIDSHTAAVTPLGMGQFGQNALGRTSDGRYWSTTRISTTFYQFTQVNQTSGTATVAASGTDIRDFATAPDNWLLGIRNGTTNPYEDSLVRVDPAAGFWMTIGSTGFADIQGLVMHQGVLYAWDVFAGLLVVNPNTGAAIDPFPSVGGPAYQQSLCSHPDGRLLLGGGDSNGADQLFEVDVTTGGTTLIGTMPMAYDIRGIEPLGGFAVPFGQGCSGVHGDVFLGVTGSLQAGGHLNSVSSNHAPNSVGALIFGLSATANGSAPLPQLLDPLLGTNNCSLFVSLDVTQLTFAGAGAPATLQYGFSIPSNMGGLVFHLQHACFEAVPGSSSWSNGVTIRVQ